MNRKIGIVCIICLSAIMLVVDRGGIFAQELKPIKLVAPRLERGKLLMQALKLRESRRDFIDTFGDKPQRLTLGNQSRKPEGLKWLKGLVALSVNTEDTPHRAGIYRKQAPRLASH